MSAFAYSCPVHIEFGPGKVRLLPQLVAGRRCLVLAHRSVPQPLVHELLGPSTRLLLVEPEPDVRTLAALYRAARAEPFEVLVAIGGGSVIDSAKVISVSAPPPQPSDFSFVQALWERGGGDHVSVPVIAVPTTAGSGSDVTPWATVWDKVARRKHSLCLADLWPAVTVCDPALTLTLPRAVTLHAGLDALSHALEAIWSKHANPLSTDLAVAAARGVQQALPQALADPQHVASREAMMLAALRAGLAFSNTRTGIAHALSYYLTLHKGHAHGLACGAVLPVVIDAIAGHDAAVDRALAAVFGAATSAPLRRLLEQLGVSADLREYGLGRGDLEPLRASLAQTDRSANSRVDLTLMFEALDRVL